MRDKQAECVSLDAQDRGSRALAHESRNKRVGENEESCSKATSRSRWIHQRTSPWANRPDVSHKLTVLVVVVASLLFTNVSKDLWAERMKLSNKMKTNRERKSCIPVEILPHCTWWHFLWLQYRFCNPVEGLPHCTQSGTKSNRERKMHLTVEILPQCT